MAKRGHKFPYRIDYVYPASSERPKRIGGTHVVQSSDEETARVEAAQFAERGATAILVHVDPETSTHSQLVCYYPEGTEQPRFLVCDDVTAFDADEIGTVTATYPDGELQVHWPSSGYRKEGVARLRRVILRTPRISVPAPVEPGAAWVQTGDEEPRKTQMFHVPATPTTVDEDVRAVLSGRERAVKEFQEMTGATIKTTEEKDAENARKANERVGSKARELSEEGPKTYGSYTGWLSDNAEDLIRLDVFARFNTMLVECGFTYTAARVVEMLGQTGARGGNPLQAGIAQFEARAAVQWLRLNRCRFNALDKHALLEILFYL